MGGIRLGPMHGADSHVIQKEKGLLMIMTSDNDDEAGREQIMEVRMMDLYEIGCF